eukprot:g35377.t1
MRPGPRRRNKIFSYASTSTATERLVELRVTLSRDSQVQMEGPVYVLLESPIDYRRSSHDQLPQAREGRTGSSEGRASFEHEGTSDLK